MQRKLTITVADDVYRGLHQRVGRGGISRFIESLVRPYVVTDSDLETEYVEAMQDARSEREALEWIEADVDDWPSSRLSAFSLGCRDGERRQRGVAFISE